MNISFQPSGGDSGTGSEVNSMKKSHQAEKSKPKIEDVKTSEGPLGQVKYHKKKIFHLQYFPTGIICFDILPDSLVQCQVRLVDEVMPIL